MENNIQIGAMVEWQPRNNSTDSEGEVVGYKIGASTNIVIVRLSDYSRLAVPENEVLKVMNITSKRLFSKSPTSL